MYNYILIYNYTYKKSSSDMYQLDRSRVNNFIQRTLKEGVDNISTLCTHGGWGGVGLERARKVQGREAVVHQREVGGELWPGVREVRVEGDHGVRRPEAHGLRDRDDRKPGARHLVVAGGAGREPEAGGEPDPCGAGNDVRHRVVPARRSAVPFRRPPR